MNKINWKLRIKNKTTLLALITCAIAFIYQVLGIFGVTTSISQDTIMQFAGLALNILVALGVLVDPTTQGIEDSVRALEYTEPK